MAAESEEKILFIASAFLTVRSAVVLSIYVVVGPRKVLGTVAERHSKTFGLCLYNSV